MSPSPAAFPLLCQASARKIPRQFSNWQWWFRPSMRRRNVRPLTESLRNTLASIEWEAIFVDDDSPDGTAALIREVGRLNRRVRVIQRIGRHGLASACIEGMLATPRATSPRWTRTRSTMNRFCRSCWIASRRKSWISSSAAAMPKVAAWATLRGDASRSVGWDRVFLEEVVHRLSGIR